LGAVFLGEDDRGAVPADLERIREPGNAASDHEKIDIFQAHVLELSAHSPSLLARRSEQLPRHSSAYVSRLGSHASKFHFAVMDAIRIGHHRVHFQFWTVRHCVSANWYPAAKP